MYNLGLRPLLVLHIHISPSASSGQRNCASWASHPQKSATLRPQMGGEATKSVRDMWWHWREEKKIPFLMFCWPCVSIRTCNETNMTVGGPADSRLRYTARVNCRIYTLLLRDDGQLASPKHVEVDWLNKRKINSATSLFYYTHTLRCFTFRLVNK
jgi:hypothetical protein